MKTHFFKRGIAGLLSLVMCLSAFIGLGTTTAFAAGEQAEVYLISFPRSGDGKAKKVIDEMPAEQVKEYLKKMIEDNFVVGLEIIKKQK